MSDHGDLVRRERRGATLLLTLDHPPVNVLSVPVVDALSEAFGSAEADPEVRAVVLASAADKAFGAGADVREMQHLTVGAAREHARRGQALTRQMERLPFPIVAAIHGVCLGGGLEVALACDFLVASEDAQFGQPEINLGVMPGWGGTQRLPRRIGAARARRWILTGQPVPAREAEDSGLVDRVVPRAELLPSALALAGELAEKPPVALAAAKYAVLHAIDPGIDEGLAYELELWSKLFGTEGQRERMAAFLDKRAPPALTRSRWKEECAGFPWQPGASAASGGKRDKSPAPPRR